MKNVVLILILLVNIAFGQSSALKPSLVKSRTNDNKEITFSVNKPLAAIRLSRNITTNSLYKIEGKKAIFYVFQGKKVDENLLNNITFDKITVQSDPNDIYVSDDEKGIVVLRRGDFIFKTFQSPKSENYSITKFEAILDTIPKEPYYFDFRGENTKIKKDCYDTTRADGKFAPFEHQGFGKTTSNISKPEVEWIKAENFSDKLTFEKYTNDENLQSIYRLKVKFDSTQANAINNNLVYTFYKIKNQSNVYRILLKFDFGCDNKKKKKTAILGNTPVLNNPIIIYPPDRPLKQPDPTGMGVTPPSN